MKKGKFIVIEGLDGSGKTTQAKIITETLRAKGINVINQAEPTTHEFGKMCREVLGGEKKVTKSQFALLFTADRIDHNVNAEDGIEKLLNEGYNIICDRYYYSTFAYQGIDVGLDWLMNLNLDCKDIRKPDLCIFLDLFPEKSMERINANRSKDEIEIYETEEYLTDIRNRFYDVINILKDTENIEIINADADILTVSQKIKEAILKVL